MGVLSEASCDGTNNNAGHCQEELLTHKLYCAEEGKKINGCISSVPEFHWKRQQESKKGK